MVRTKEQNLEQCKRWRERHREYYLKKSKENSKKYYREHKDKHLKRTHDYMEKLRKEVFSHYSPELKCQRCGFDNLRALSIDHIKGNGAEHRKQIWGERRGTGCGNRIYCWLKKNGYPEGFQVLCMNCQFIKKHENKEN